MTSAPEQFAIQLGRASQRSSRYLRFLNRTDREDVIASAILMCWETRASFDASTMDLERWFVEKLKMARKHLRQSVPRAAVHQLEELAASDDTAREAETQILAERLAAELTDQERQVVQMLAEGYTIRDVRRDLGARSDVTRRMFNKLRRFKDYLPDLLDPPAKRTYPSDSEHMREPAPIDHEIEKMLRRPASERADCVPCWRCMWYAGLKPKHYRTPVIADAEVQVAVLSTELAKIRIAGGEIPKGV